MKNMKKLLTCLLTLALLASMLAVTAMAAPGNEAVTAAATVDENGAVSLVLTAGADIASGRITVSYDEGLLTFQEAEAQGTVTSVNPGQGSVTIGFAAPGSKPVHKGEPLATIRFTGDRSWKYTQLAVTLDDMNTQEGVHVQLPAVHLGIDSLPFTDVAEGSWYYDAVKYTYQNGLFYGISDTLFAPNSTMTRSMFITVLGRMAGVTPNKNAQTKFTDVKAGSYYAGYVAWAAENGIVKGTSETTFSPNVKITRQEMVTFLYRFAGYLGQGTGADVSVLEGFADAGEINGWAKAAMAWAVDQGIVKGTGKGLEPRAWAIRAQAAQLLMMFDLNVD